MDKIIDYVRDLHVVKEVKKRHRKVMKEIPQEWERRLWRIFFGVYTPRRIHREFTTRLL